MLKHRLLIGKRRAWLSTGIREAALTCGKVPRRLTLRIIRTPKMPQFSPLKYLVSLVAHLMGTQRAV